MSGSYYALNSKINNLQAEIDALTPSPPLPPTADIVTTNTAQTITGLKTFSTLPESSVVPTTGDQLVNKTYADGLVTVPTLDQVLTTGNTSDVPIVLTDGATSTNTLNKFGLTITDGVINSAFSGDTMLVQNAQVGTTANTTITAIPTSSQSSTTFQDITNAVTSQTVITSQFNQTDYSASVIDTTLGLSGTKTLITIGGSVLDTDTATNGSATGIQNRTTTTAGANTGQQLTTGTGIVSSLNTTIDATNAGQTHLFTTPLQDTIIQLTASNGTAGIASSYATTPFNVFTQGEFSQNTGGSICSVQATDIAGSQNQLLRMDCPLIGDAKLEHLATGASASTKNLRITSTGNLLFTTDNITSTASNLGVISSTAGYTGSPILTLTNTNATAGSTIGVPLVEYYKSGRNSVATDIICSQSFNAKNFAGTKTEFAKIEASVRNTGSGNDDGSIAFSGLINGVQTEFFRVNGADSENNMFLPLDMNNQSIKSSTGNLNLSTTSSTGTGDITATAKRNVDITSNGAGGSANITAVSSVNITATGDNLTLTAGATLLLDSADLQLANTTTTTTTPNHTSALSTTSNIGDINTYLKVKLNNADIWIPYFTTDPSV